MAKKFYSIIITVIIVGITFISCSKDTNDFDVEIVIQKTYRNNSQGGSAIVKYQIINIDDEDIRGWNIYFRVSMKSGQQVVAFNGLTYNLEPGEISETLIANGRLPDHFKNSDEPITASLRFIEVY